MHTVTLIKKDVVADGTMRFHLSKPEGFAYRAGQTIDLTLIDPTDTDAEGSSRTFSIVSTPQDADLQFATRMRDTAFKRTLRDMPEGTAISLDGPFGSFTLHENIARAAVFLSGGIGITPFHSMIKDATERGLSNPIFLFFSNRQPKDAAFLDELNELQKRNPHYTFIPTMTDAATDASWQGARGYIDRMMLTKYLQAAPMPIYYLAGPPAMVAAMRTMLTDMNVSNDDIRFEEFAGY